MWLKFLLFACVGTQASSVAGHFRRDLLGKASQAGKDTKVAKDAKSTTKNGKIGKETKDERDYANLTPPRFNGVLKVQTPTKVLYEDTQGFMNIEYKAPFSTSSVFPIGSNTKLLAAIAAYQLHEGGHFDVEDDVADYLDQADFAAFGFPEESRWCPSLLGDATKTCQNITFVNLMAMNSGIINSWNCDYEEGSPFIAYCNSSLGYQETASVAAVVGSFIHNPLQFEPGTEYGYANLNWVLLTYFIEKYSNLSFGEYLKTYIFDPLGMKKSLFDPQNGRFGMIKDRVSEYIMYYDPKNDYSQLAVGACSKELDPGAVSGAGGALSSLDDFAKLYFSFFNPATKGAPLLANPASWDAMIARHQLMPATLPGYSGKFYFSQGITTYYIKEGDPLPALISYQGGTTCAHTGNILDIRSGVGPLLAQAWRNDLVLEVTAADFAVGKNAKTGLFEDRTSNWTDASSAYLVALALHAALVNEPMT
eukprot:gb/GEZN01006594.1/.p1 GENE.gb/GEZN01006594.1/~~gb/GEZN01006594.1/.p1  ORF type:complete len:479 (+),score=61.40 gb/GEZN01006594.1/:120-1556(+)